MKLTLFDEDKLREIVEEAVERLKAEGYIWRDGDKDELLAEAKPESSAQDCKED